MDYQIVLPRELNPDEFVANWNASPDCRTAAAAQLGPTRAKAFDPTLDLAVAVLSGLALNITANALYDLIKATLTKQGVRKRTEIQELTQPDGTRLLIVKIEER